MRKAITTMRRLTPTLLLKKQKTAAPSVCSVMENQSFTGTQPEENIFSFGPDLTMYVKPENGSLILDGGRIKNIVLKKVD